MQKQIKALTESRGLLVTELEGLLAKETRTADDSARMTVLNTEIESKSSELETLERSFKNTQFTPTNTHSTTEERDMAKFSMSKFVRGASNGGENLDGLEKEMHQEGVKELRDSGATNGYNGGVVLPSQLLNKRAEKRAVLQVGTFGSYGETWGGVGTQIAPWVAAIIKATYMDKVGIMPSTGLVGDVKRLQAGAATFAFKTEVAAASDGNPDNSYYTLSPKRLPGYIDISKQSLLQWEGVDGYIMSTIEQGIALALQNSIINGAGSSGDLTGLLAISGITQYYAGGAGTNSGTNADGAALVYADLINLYKGLTGVSINPDNIKYLINSSVLGKGLATQAFSSTDSPLLKDGYVHNINQPYVVSNHIPSNLTKGTGTGLSAIICGDFSGVDLGQWGGIEIFADPFTQATTGTMRYHVSSFWDVNVKQTAMFTKMKDIITA